MLNSYVCLVGLSVLLTVIILHSDITIRVPIAAKGIFAIVSNGVFSV